MYLGLLGLGGVGAVVVLSAAVCQHLGHGNRAAHKVGVVVQPLPDLQAHKTAVENSLFHPWMKCPQRKNMYIIDNAE